MDGPWHGSHGLGPHRGLTGRGGGGEQARGRVEATETERRPADGRGLEDVRLAGCLFWWFGGREEGRRGRGGRGLSNVN